jgi:hypothetical protein
MHSSYQDVIFPKGVRPIDAMTFGSRTMAQSAGLHEKFKHANLHAYLVYGSPAYWDSWAWMKLACPTEESAYRVLPVYITAPENFSDLLTFSAINLSADDLPNWRAKTKGSSSGARI